MNFYTTICQKDLDYMLVGLSVVKGSYMYVKVDGIPTATNTPYSYSWFQKQVPNSVGGYIDYQSGTTIQTNTGTLASTTTSNVILSIPIGLQTFPLGKGQLFSLMFQLQNNSNYIIGAEKLFMVGDTVQDPTNPDLLPFSVSQKNGQKVLTSSDVTAINGSGFDLSTAPNGGVVNSLYPNFQLFFRNGQRLGTDEYTITGNLFKVTSSVSNFFTGDLFQYIFIS